MRAIKCAVLSPEEADRRCRGRSDARRAKRSRSPEGGGNRPRRVRYDTIELARRFGSASNRAPTISDRGSRRAAIAPIVPRSLGGGSPSPGRQSVPSWQRLYGRWAAPDCPRRHELGRADHLNSWEQRAGRSAAPRRGSRRASGPPNAHRLGEADLGGPTPPAGRVRPGDPPGCPRGVDRSWRDGAADGDRGRSRRDPVPGCHRPIDPATGAATAAAGQRQVSSRPRSPPSIRASGADRRRGSVRGRRPVPASMPDPRRRSSTMSGRESRRVPTSNHGSGRHVSATNQPLGSSRTSSHCLRARP